MSELKTIQLPDIGDFDAVEVIEVLVNVGDVIEMETSLITVESDKASMEIPAPFAGTVTNVMVKTGDKVSIGSDLLVVEASDEVSTNDAPANVNPGTTSKPEANTTAVNTVDVDVGSNNDNSDADYDLVVIGAGPGGYTAAFRAADLGNKVLLIERYSDLGGVCLNVGCIPSKALLHTAAVIEETRTMGDHGVTFAEPTINLDKLRSFKENVIGQLTGGLAGLAKQRKVSVMHGNAQFTSANTISIDGDTSVSFKHAIIAAGSQSIKIPGLPYDDDRLMDSTGALALADIPKRLLVIGGGISPLEKRLRKQFENIFLGAKVTNVASTDQGLHATFEGGKAPQEDTFDRVLLAVGRSPNGKKINAEAAGVNVDERGFIPVDSQQRTNVEHIFAIGDIVGQPMLAHKATHEGKVAAEVISGHKAYFDAKTIPSVAYTDPEVAWMGLTETEAKERNIAIEKASFPWAASGRSLSMARNEGITKVIYEPETKRILGAGMVGPNAGELIAEAVLALEMGAYVPKKK